MIRVPGGRTGGEWGNPVRQRLFAEGVSRRDGRPGQGSPPKIGGEGWRVRAAALPALIWAQQAIIRRWPNTPAATGSRLPRRRDLANSWQGWERVPGMPMEATPRNTTCPSPLHRDGACHDPAVPGPSRAEAQTPPSARVPPGASCQSVPGSSCRPAGTLRAPGMSRKNNKLNSKRVQRGERAAGATYQHHIEEIQARQARYTRDTRRSGWRAGPGVLPRRPRRARRFYLPAWWRRASRRGWCSSQRGAARRR